MYVPTIENALVPVVVEQSSRGERSFDIFHVCYVSVIS
jgi:ATP-dependent Clp protease protease subunit